MWYLVDENISFNYIYIFCVLFCIGKFVSQIFSDEKRQNAIQFTRRFQCIIQEYLTVFSQRCDPFNGEKASNSGNATENKSQWKLTSEHIDMIAMRKWKDLLVWIVFHPDELLYVDKRNQTVLHHACLFRAPAQIIHMLLYQKPELAKIQNIDDEIPLHWAVRLSAPSEVIKLLLSVHPSSACCIKDKDGNTALSMVWERCESSLLDIWWRSGQQAVLGNNGWTNILFYFQCHSYSSNLLQKNSLCWDCDDNAQLSQIEQHSKVFQPLHTATHCASCPLMLYTLMLRVYKDDIYKEDNLGRIPLAVACLHPISNRSIGVLTKVHLLIAEYPFTAQMMDNQGRLPLFTALESSLTWSEGIDPLIASYPKSLLLCDSVTRLPAFLSAAVHAKSTRAALGRLASDKSNNAHTSTNEQQESWDKAHLTTIFLILRKDPAQINVSSICLNI
jgi:hypothetical protein